MTPFHTMNPVPSADARDRFDNSLVFDTYINGNVLETPDRLGVARKTLRGMDNDFQNFLLNSGYQQIGNYAAGLVVSARNQVFLYNGEYYRAAAATALPYTLTGTWATDGPKFVGVGDAILRQALAAANGVDLVTGATPQMQTVAALQAHRGRYRGDQVDLLGNDSAHPGRGARAYWWDDASTAAQQLPNIVQVTGVTTGRWVLVDIEVVRLSDWGMYGDSSDNTSQIAALMSYVTALGAVGRHVQVQAAAGDYKASTWPNMALRGFVVEPMGEVFFTNTGTGPNLVLDGGALSGMKVDGFSIGLPGKPITLRGGSSAGQGVYTRAVVGKNCYANVNIFGCGTASAAFRSEWAVLARFDLNITPGDMSTGSLAWYQGGVPAVGISLGQRLAGEQTSYCWFPGFVANACGIAIYLDSTLGNNIELGDAEYSSVLGLLTTVNALKDKITGMNFEVNPTDISCLGNGIVFDKCHAVNIVFQNVSVNCKAIACLTDTINIVAGAVGTHVALTSFSRGISSSLITDNGTQSRHTANYNMTTNKFQNAPVAVLQPGVGLPISWTNNTGDTVLAQIVGGTIGNVTVTTVVTGDVWTIPYPMARIPVLNGETITATGSANPTSFKVLKGV